MDTLFNIGIAWKICLVVVYLLIGVVVAHKHCMKLRRRELEGIWTKSAEKLKLHYATIWPVVVLTWPVHRILGYIIYGIEAVLWKPISVMYAISVFSIFFIFTLPIAYPVFLVVVLLQLVDDILHRWMGFYPALGWDNIKVVEKDDCLEVYSRF